jgi:tRNA 2-thiocytidine biosynthesis protein TtcA
METYQEIEKSLITKFRPKIWSKFIKAINDYELIEPNDKIAVCISGGKDSFCLAKCLQELQRHGKFNFSLEFIVMDPGYNKKSREKIINNAKLLNIPINIFDSDIFKVSNFLNEKNPCYLCARMRRGALYAKAKELGCNKIALGHHFNDVIETVIMSIFYAGEFKTIMPKLHSKNFPGIDLIRPLYLIKEEDIIKWQDYHHLTFLNCACEFTKKSKTENISKRKEVKELIKKLKENNPYIDSNILRSTENVNLTTLLSYHDDDNTVNFLDTYKK